MAPTERGGEGGGGGKGGEGSTPPPPPVPGPGQLSTKLPLLGQNHLHKLLVVDVTLSVFLSVDEDLHLLLAHLLPQAHQQVPQLHGRDPAVPLLVKVPQTLHKIINSVGDLLAGDCL